MAFLNSHLIHKVGNMSNMTLGMLGVLNEIIHVKLLASAKHRVSTQYVEEHGDKGLPNTRAAVYLKEGWRLHQQSHLGQTVAL